MRRTIGERITLSFDFTAGPAVARVDVSQFESALLNLVINARDALPEGGHIGIGPFPPMPASTLSWPPAVTSACASATMARASIPPSSTRCSTPSSPPSLRAAAPAWDCRASTVSPCSRAATRIRSTLGVGTDVTLLLPAADGETSLAPSAAPEDSARLAGHEHVLVVEDMPSVRMLIAETLIEAGYRCSQAGDVETAQALLEADPSIDLLLTDVGLPRLSGRQLAEWARRSRPALPVVLMTGYAEKASSREGFVDERMELVLKPFEGADLLGKIRALLDNG